MGSAGGRSFEEGGLTHGPTPWAVVQERSTGPPEGRSACVGFYPNSSRRLGRLEAIAPASAKLMSGVRHLPHAAGALAGRRAHSPTPCSAQGQLTRAQSDVVPVLIEHRFEAPCLAVCALSAR